MSEAYGAFAYAYDQALGERFFRAAKRMIDEAAVRYPTPKRTHLDVACGTGLVVDYFRRLGWKSTGVDASLEMLATGAARGGGRLVAGDFGALPFRARFARITCLYDSLNHVLDRDDLVTAFRNIRPLLDRDGLFLFDMNHPEIYPEVWGIVEPFVASGPDFHLEIATSYRKREKAGRAVVSGWANVAGRRVEIHEEHRQRAYSQKEIVKSLEEAGITPIEILEFDPYDEADAIEAQTVKLFFVCSPAT